MKNLQKKFKVKEYVCMESVFGNTPREYKTMFYHVEWNKDDESGFFEIYDEESGGDDYYGSGSLEFLGNELCGYDGVMCLSDCSRYCYEEFTADY